MTEITGSDKFFTNITTDAEMWESLIEQAKDKINGYARDTLIGDMTGVAGSKTLSVDSQAAGFIRDIAVALYQKNVVSSGAQSSSFGLGALSQSQSASSSSGGEIENLAKEAALRLKEIEVSYG